MKSYNVIAIASIAAFSIFAAGCKPTEAGYKAAYDAAVGKREAVNADIKAEGHKVVSMDAPRQTVSAGVRIRVISEYLSEASPDALSDDGRFRVAAGRYRMAANARAQVGDLKSSGFRRSRLMKDGKDQWYAVAGVYPTLEEAAACVDELQRKLRNESFVGLDGAPLVIESPR